MPKGLKMTSSPIAVSGSASAVTDPTAVQFSSKRVDLQLNPLDNEVFVVTGVKIDFTNPIIEFDGSATGFKFLSQKASLSTTEQTTYAGIASPSVIAASAIDATANLTTQPNYYAAMEQNAMDAPPATMDYLAIIATNDFFVNFRLGSGYLAGQTGGIEFRVYGYRAVADASTYAALVQSELLSS